MKLLNLIIIFNQKKDKVLMIHRSKDPYVGLYNFVGGKIEENEDILESAYRELFEETGISKHDTVLKPFIDFAWHFLDMKMFVFIGKINNHVNLVKEVHELYWIDVHENFFDMNKFAGEGNIGHMMELYFQNTDILE